MAALAHAGLVTVRALSAWAGPRTDSTLEEGADITAGMVLRVSLSGFIEPCLPTRAERPPSGPGWVHEIKHDGFRMVVRRDPAGVRLLTRRGNDWTERFPLIAAAAGALKVRSCLLDGEAVACEQDGMPKLRPAALAPGRCLSILEVPAGPLARHAIGALKPLRLTPAQWRATGH
jgi:ATP-dependent DNA ligase